MTLPMTDGLRWFPTETGLLVAELELTVEDTGLGITRRFRVRPSPVRTDRDREVVLWRVPADALNPGYPDYRCSCDLPSCVHVRAVLAFLGGPRDLFRWIASAQRVQRACLAFGRPVYVIPEHYFIRLAARCEN